MSTPTSIHPLGDRVLVEVIEQEETKNGLYIPDAAKERPTNATVIAVGSRHLDDGTLFPMPVKAGDTVLISPFGGTVVVHLDKTYRLLDSADVLATIA